MAALHPGNEDIANKAAPLLINLKSPGGPGLDALPFRSSFTSCGTNSIFSITKSGLMGIGPRAMKPGDIIALPFGVGTPYALPPEDPGHPIFGR